MLFKKEKRYLLLLLIFLICGCRTMQDYNIVIQNNGTKTITDANVQYDDFQSLGGIVSPGYGKSHHNPDYPIPEKAIVEWRTEDGKLHQKEVDVIRHIPKDFRGDIQFEIDDNNEVKVKSVPDTY
jgi:hypothetical protein